MAFHLWIFVLLCGFLLESGAEDGKAFLLVADYHLGIVQVSVETDQSHTLPITNPGHAWDVAFDPVEGKVYWSDVSSRTIRSAQLDGSDDVIVLHLHSVCCAGIYVSLDPTERLVFYADAENRNIGAVFMNGTGHRIVRHEKSGGFHDLVVDSVEKWVYFTEHDPGSVIMRVRYNGTVDVFSVPYLPQALALDSKERQLYWTSIHDKNIQTRFLNKSDETVVLQGSPSSAFVFMAVHGGTVFYTDDDTDKQDRVMWVSSDSTTNGTLAIGQVTWPLGLEVVTLTSRSSRVSVRTATVPGDSLLVADLEAAAIFVIDLAADQTEKLNLNISNTSRPYDVDLDPIEGKVYWSDLTDRTIRSARMDGSDDVTLLRFDDILFSAELAVDPVQRLLFYTEYWSHNISVLLLQNGSTSLLLNTHPGYPCKVAVDTQNSLLYYGVSGTGARIARMRYDGSESQTLVNLTLNGCFGLTLDVSNERLYWTNPGLGRIESMRLDGSARKIVLQERYSHHYNFISVLHDTVYFTDTLQAYRDRVRRVSTQGRGLGVVGLGLLQSARGHRAFSGSPPPSSTSTTTPTSFRPSSTSSVRYEAGYRAGQDSGQWTWMGTGIGIGMAIAFFIVLVALLCLLCRRRSSRQQDFSSSVATSVGTQVTTGSVRTIAMSEVAGRDT